MAPDSKTNYNTFDAASVSSSSIMSEKEKAQQESEKKPKESLAKRVVKGKDTLVP